MITCLLFYGCDPDKVTPFPPNIDAYALSYIQNNDSEYLWIEFQYSHESVKFVTKINDIPIEEYLQKKRPIPFHSKLHDSTTHSENVDCIVVNVGTHRMKCEIPFDQGTFPYEDDFIIRLWPAFSATVKDVNDNITKIPSLFWLSPKFNAKDAQISLSNDYDQDDIIDTNDACPEESEVWDNDDNPLDGIEDGCPNEVMQQPSDNTGTTGPMPLVPGQHPSPGNIQGEPGSVDVLSDAGGCQLATQSHTPSWLLFVGMMIVIYIGMKISMKLKSLFIAICILMFMPSIAKAWQDNDIQLHTLYTYDHQGLHNCLNNPTIIPNPETCLFPFIKDEKTIEDVDIIAMVIPEFIFPESIESYTIHELHSYLQISVPIELDSDSSLGKRVYFNGWLDQFDEADREITLSNALKKTVIRVGTQKFPDKCSYSKQDDQHILTCTLLKSSLPETGQIALMLAVTHAYEGYKYVVFSDRPLSENHMKVSEFMSSHAQSPSIPYEKKITSLMTIPAGTTFSNELVIQGIYLPEEESDPMQERRLEELIAERLPQNREQQEDADEDDPEEQLSENVDPETPGDDNDDPSDCSTTLCDPPEEDLPFVPDPAAPIDPVTDPNSSEDIPAPLANTDGFYDGCQLMPHSAFAMHYYMIVSVLMSLIIRRKK